MLCLSKPDEAFFIVQAASFYVYKPIKTATFHDPSIYSATKPILLEFHELYLNHAANTQFSFVSFMTVELQSLIGKSNSLKVLFLTIIWMFEYDARTNKHQWNDRGEQHQKRFIARDRRGSSCEHDQPKMKPKPEAFSEVTESRNLQSCKLEPETKGRSSRVSVAK